MNLAPGVHSPAHAFTTLGLPETATPAEVKARWRELCMIHHPDRGGNACEFDEIRRAYRAAYAKASAPKVCSQCGGNGKVQHANGWASINLPSPRCGGTGEEKSDGQGSGG